MPTNTVYPKKYAHSFCFAVLCCGYTLTDSPISTRLTLLALWQSNDCPSASKATLMNMDKFFTWIHYERLHNHNKAKHNKTVCIFLGIYCKKQQYAIYIAVIGFLYNSVQYCTQHENNKEMYGKPTQEIIFCLQKQIAVCRWWVFGGTWRWNTNDALHV